MAGLPPDALKTCKDPGIDVVEQACHRSEQHGIEHIFVVARAGVRLLLSDDAEDEFAVGEVDADGVLAVAVPVADDRHVAGCAVGEADVG